MHFCNNMHIYTNSAWDSRLVGGFTWIPVADSILGFSPRAEWEVNYSPEHFGAAVIGSGSEMLHKGTCLFLCTFREGFGRVSLRETIQGSFWTRKKRIVMQQRSYIFNKYKGRDSLHMLNMFGFLVEEAPEKGLLRQKSSLFSQPHH